MKYYKFKRLILKSAIICLFYQFFTIAYGKTWTEKHLNLEIYCNLNMPSENIKLRFSQKELKKNGYKVGWGAYESEAKLARFKPELGSEVVIVRCLPPGYYATIAKGLVQSQNGNLILAQVQSFETDLASHKNGMKEAIETKNFMKRPMVGDEVIPIFKNIKKVTSISPLFRMTTNNLFARQEDGSFSYSLSEDGQQLLRRNFEKLKILNGRIFIEGFVLTSGEREKLRTESLMRAQTVSTFLRREFNLKPEQVIPIGFGNDWLTSGFQPLAELENDNFKNGVIMKIM